MHLRERKTEFTGYKKRRHKPSFLSSVEFSELAWRYSKALFEYRIEKLHVRIPREICNFGNLFIGICKHFWSKYENELKNSGDLFYTWQYDIRWAATALRKTGRMKDANLSPSGVWEII